MHRKQNTNHPFWTIEKKKKIASHCRNVPRVIAVITVITGPPLVTMNDVNFFRDISVEWNNESLNQKPHIQWSYLFGWKLWDFNNISLFRVLPANEVHVVLAYVGDWGGVTCHRAAADACALDPTSNHVSYYPHTSLRCCALTVWARLWPPVQSSKQ